jgi:hypothetical protein
MATDPKPAPAFARRNMSPTPPKPTIVRSQVDGSGAALTVVAVAASKFAITIDWSLGTEI